MSEENQTDRVTFTIHPDLLKRLDDAQRKSYYNTRTSFMAHIIDMALAEIERHG